MRDSCEAGNDYAEGYSIGQEDSGGLGRVGVGEKERVNGRMAEVLFVVVGEAREQRDVKRRS